MPVDIDGDGDLDIVMQSLQGLRIIENQNAAQSFARVRLRATATEPHALGARVRLQVGAIQQQRIVTLCEGFQSQIPLDLHFGLGEATRIAALTVDWPSGHTDHFSDLPTNVHLTLVEGSREVIEKPIVAWPESTRPVPAAAASLLAVAADLHGTRRPLLQSPVGATGDGEPEVGEPEASNPEALASPAERATVVNFWAPWCAPCMRELPDLRTAALEMRATTRFIGVSVETEDLPSVKRSIAAHELPYEQRVANEELLRSFFGSSGEVALPSTFVFDMEGRLRRVYRRPIDGLELNALLASFDTEATFAYDLLRRATAEIEKGALREAAGTLRQVIEADPSLGEAQFQLGRLWTLAGRTERAETAFFKASSLAPSHGAAWFNLGVARLQLERFADAIPALLRAAELMPTDVEAVLALGSAQARAGSLERALRSFEIACALEVNSSQAHLLRSRVLKDLGRTAEAQEALATALRLDSQEQR